MPEVLPRRPIHLRGGLGDAGRPLERLPAAARAVVDVLAAPAAAVPRKMRLMGTTREDNDERMMAAT